MLHPDNRLQTAWNFAQIGLLIFPLIPWLGALCLSWALFVIWRQQYHTMIQRPLNWVLAVLVGWLSIASCFSIYRLDAFLGLFNFLPFFAVFAAFSVLIQTPTQLRQLAQILVATSVPVVVIGFGQLFCGWSSPAALQGIFGWAIAPHGNPPGRMASVFMYTNILAGYLVIVFILSLGLLIASFHPVKRKKLSFSLLFLGVAVIGNLAALILTNSRNAWAITVFASLAFAVYQGWRWLIAGVGAIAGSIIWAAFGPAPVQQWLRQVIPTFFWQRLTDQLYPNRPVESLRTTQWQFAWFLTQQRPWTGWGLRNFSPLYQAQAHIWLGHPHNFLLMLTAEIGIPATLLFCSWVGWIVFQGVQLLRKWSTRTATNDIPTPQEQLIFFSFLLAFLACILFNTVDVTTFDLRLNTLGWLLLSAINGVVYHWRNHPHYQHRLNC